MRHLKKFGFVYVGMLTIILFAVLKVLFSYEYAAVVAILGAAFLVYGIYRLVKN